MRVVFMGTPEFAVPSLEMLIKEDIEVIAAVTQPDRPVGRKRIITPPPVKMVAVEHNIPVYQPERVKDEEFVKVLTTLQPDIITVVAFGQILPSQVLKIPKIGCINVHASLLPKYRGAAPVQWAIINGEKTTGVTTMWMDEGLDTGDIFLQEAIDIKEDWTTLELFNELSVLGGRLLIQTLEQVKSGNLIRKPQDHSRASYAPLLKKETGMIDWQKGADVICNLIRGTYPWPCAYTMRNGKEIKIFKAKPYPSGKAPAPGTFRGLVKNEGFLVGTGTDDLLVMELQEAGGKRMRAIEYLAGHQIKEGDLFADI